MRRCCDTSRHHCVLAVDTRCAQRLRRLRTASRCTSERARTVHVKRFTFARNASCGLDVKRFMSTRACTTGHCHQDTVTRYCHQALSPGAVTWRCHRTLSPGAVTWRCHQRCHQNAVTRTLSPKRCHQSAVTSAVARHCHHDTVTRTLIRATCWKPELASGTGSIAVSAVAEGAAYFALRRNSAERGLQNLPHARDLREARAGLRYSFYRGQRSPKALRTSRYAGTARSAVSRICRTRARSASLRSRSGGRTGPP